MKLIKIRVIALFAAIFMLVLSAVSCGDGYDIPESTDEEKKTALYIGDHLVPYEQYRYFFLNYKYEYDGGDAEYWSRDDVDKDAVYDEIREKTSNALLRCYATFDLCKAYGIDYDSKDMKKTINESVNYYIENDFGGVDGYIENLAAANMTDSVFRFLLTRLECDTLLSDELIYNGVIKTDSESVMNAITDENEFCHAKQILIKNDEGEDPAANYERARNALNAASLGIDFDTLVAEYGEDPEMIVNPTGYYFTHNELIEEFEKAAFALEVGEMSGIVESYIGYHIILRCELDPGYISENYDDLLESYLAWRYQAAVESEMAKLTVTETDFLKSLSVEDITG